MPVMHEGISLSRNKVVGCNFVSIPKKYSCPPFVKFLLYGVLFSINEFMEMDEFVTVDTENIQTNEREKLSFLFTDIKLQSL
jgi:hypothetical protein